MWSAMSGATFNRMICSLMMIHILWTPRIQQSNPSPTRLSFFLFRRKIWPLNFLCSLNNSNVLRPYLISEALHCRFSYFAFAPSPRFLISWYLYFVSQVACVGTCAQMPTPPPITPLNISYIDEDGHPHFITYDGLPPNNGVPPPPEPEIPPPPVYGFPLALSTPMDQALPPSSSTYGLESILEPPQVPHIRVQYLESYRPPPSLQPPLLRIEYIKMKFIQHGVRPIVIDSQAVTVTRS